MLNNWPFFCQADSAYHSILASLFLRAFGKIRTSPGSCLHSHSITLTIYFVCVHPICRDDQPVYSCSVLKINIKCDQERLVCKERKVRVLQEIQKRHLAGANPARPGQPGRSVASLATGHVGERAEAGRQRVRRCVGVQTSEPCEVSLENDCLSRASKVFGYLKTTSSPSPDGTGW